MRITRNGQKARVGMGYAAAIILIAVFVISLCSRAFREKDERRHREFAAWVKYTGNARQITIQEFETLKELGVIETK